MKNILFYLHRFPGLGGIETVTSVIANYLVNKGFNVYFYSIISDEVSIKLDYRIKVAHPNSTKIAEQTEDLLFYCISKNIDYIVLHDDYDLSAEVVIAVTNRLQCKLFVVEHSDPIGVIEGSKRVMKRKLNGNLCNLLWLIKNYNYDKRISRNYLSRKKKLFEACDKYIVLSKQFEKGIEVCIPNFDRQKLVAINNPLTIPIRQIRKKQNVAVFIARLEAVKRVDYLLQILSQVAPKYSEWIFRIYGDGKERELVENFIGKRRFPNIEYCGSTADVSLVLQEAKILLMTSEYEGWGLVLTEAMANGVVPIAFASYLSIYDIIDDGVNGVLVSPFNIDEYSSKLSNLLDGGLSYQIMHQKVYSKASQFHIDYQIGSQWIELFSK